MDLSTHALTPKDQVLVFGVCQDLIGGEALASYQSLYLYHSASRLHLNAFRGVRAISKVDFGNCWVKPLHFLNAGIKKRFGDKFTASFSVRNLIERPQHIGARDVYKRQDPAGRFSKRSCCR